MKCAIASRVVVILFSLTTVTGRKKAQPSVNLVTGRSLQAIQRTGIFKHHDLNRLVNISSELPFAPPDPLGSKVLVLQSTENDPRLLVQLYSSSIKHWCYLHGYWYFEDPRPLTQLTGRSTSWNRHVGTYQLLHELRGTGVEWIFYLDSDVYVKNFSFTVGELVKELQTHNEVVLKGSFLARNILNSAAYLLRIGEYAKNFIKAWWNVMPSSWIDSNNDQSALYLLFSNLAFEAKHKTPAPFPPCNMGVLTIKHLSHHGKPIKTHKPLYSWREAENCFEYVRELWGIDFYFTSTDRRVLQTEKIIVWKNPFPWPYFAERGHFDVPPGAHDPLLHCYPPELVQLAPETYPFFVRAHFQNSSLPQPKTFTPTTPPGIYIRNLTHGEQEHRWVNKEISSLSISLASDLADIHTREKRVCEFIEKYLSQGNRTKVAHGVILRSESPSHLLSYELCSGSSFMTSKYILKSIVRETTSGDIRYYIRGKKKWKRWEDQFSHLRIPNELQGVANYSQDFVFIDGLFDYIRHQHFLDYVKAKLKPRSVIFGTVYMNNDDQFALSLQGKIPSIFNTANGYSFQSPWFPKNVRASVDEFANAGGRVVLPIRVARGVAPLWMIINPPDGARVCVPPVVESERDLIREMLLRADSGGSFFFSGGQNSVGRELMKWGVSAITSGELTPRPTLGVLGNGSTPEDLASALRAVVSCGLIAVESPRSFTEIFTSRMLVVQVTVSMNWALLRAFG